MEKYIDKYQFKGFGNCLSTCSVLITEYDNADFVLLIQNEDDVGTSITNACEHIVTLIRREYKLDARTTKFFETYIYNWGEDEKPIDGIFFYYDKEKDEFCNPVWRSLNEDGEYYNILINKLI